MSISNPQKNPTHSPSFFPRMSPKEDTTIISRFGPILANVKARKTVVCKRKQIAIIILTGVWRSLVARTAGGREVAGSNPVAPIEHHKYYNS